MSQKMSEKVRRKKNKGKYFEKNQLKKIPKSLKFGEKIPESREKLPGFSNPKNLRTLFFRVIYPSLIITSSLHLLVLISKESSYRVHFPFITLSTL